MSLPFLRRAAIVLGVVAAPCPFADTLAAQLPEPARNVAVYDGIVHIDPARAILRGDWTIALERAPGVDSIELLLNRGLGVESVSGPEIVSHAAPEANGFRRVMLRFAPVDRHTKVTVRLLYTGVPVMSSDGINALGPEWIELALDSFWHPVVAGFEHRVRGQVKVVLPPGYRVVASGSTSRRADTTIIVNDRAEVPDFAFAASPALERRESARARLHAPVDARAAMPANADVVLKTTSECAELLNRQFGAQDPMPTADILLPPRSGPGYARGGYIVIAVGADTSTIGRTNFICHELAHFWSIGAAPGGPENWLNEGFAEYVAGRSVHTLLGDSAYQTLVRKWETNAKGRGPIWTAGATARPHSGVSYAKAPLLLDAFERRIGTATMDRLLQRFLTNRAARTTPELLRLVDEVAGAEQGAWFREQLGR